jgi:predicted esterase
MFSMILLYAAAFAQTSSSVTLNGHKDELFSHKNRTVIETRNNESYKRYRFDEMEDVNGQDSVPVKAAKEERIDRSVLTQQRDLSIKYSGRKLDTVEVGTRKDAKFAVIFIHGAGGSKELGASDVTFGGNFNRLKNLAVKNNGTYYSPSVDLKGDGHLSVLALIELIKKESPQAKVVIACGSAGARTCWAVADKAGSKLSGIMILGGVAPPKKFDRSNAYGERIPIIISHGTRDGVVSAKVHERFYEGILKLDPSYPIKLELFESGIHGTPIRMVDWKESLEWIFAKAKQGSTDAAQKVEPAVPKKSAR